MSTVDYTAVLTHRYPTALWALDGDDVESIAWFSEGQPPTRAELDALWPEVAIELHDEAARRQRIAAYREEADPLYMEWQAGEGTEQSWLDARAAIRARYPYHQEL